jgi:predicted TIM-barrel fold metal-dependent hydrolase
MTPPHIFDFHARLSAQPAALDRLLSTMDGCGIERAGVAAGGVMPLDLLARQLIEGGHIETDPDNGAVLDACRRSAGRLVPFYFANPHADPERYRASAKEFRALELSPAVHGLSLCDPRVLELVELAEEARHPVYIVCLHRKGAAVADLAALAARFPAVTFVLGHLGVGTIDTYAIDLVSPHGNVLVETCGGYSYTTRVAVERLGPARLLFSAEHPLQHPSVELAKFAALDLPAAGEHEIMWRNAQQLLDPADRPARED